MFYFPDPCPQLSLPLNSAWVGNDCSHRDFGPGVTCQATCEPGFEVTRGSQVRTCQTDGTWSGEDLRCERM